MKNLALVLVVATLMFVGCQDSSSPKTTKAKPTKKKTTKPATLARLPAFKFPVVKGDDWPVAGWSFTNDLEKGTTEEVDSWGQQLKEAIDSNDMDHIKTLIDPSFIDGLLAQSQPPGSQTGRDFRRGFSDSFITAKQLQDAVFLKFLGVRQTQLGPAALFRRHGADETYDYIVWQVRENNDGVLVGIDYYCFSVGEPISRIAIRIGQQFFNQIQSNAATPANFKNRISNHINLFQRAIKEGNNDEVLKQFDLLPGSHKFKKFVQLARLKSAAAVDTEIYLAAMKDYLNRFDDDPSVLILGVGYYFRIEELDKAQDSVRQLADLVGEDAMIKSLRSDLLFRQGKLDESIKEATAGMELEPEFEDNYQSRLIVACHTKNNELILATLKAIAQNLGLSDSKLADIPDFKEFCASPQYQEWLLFVED